MNLPASRPRQSEYDKVDAAMQYQDEESEVEMVSVIETEIDSQKADDPTNLIPRGNHERGALFGKKMKWSWRMWRKLLLVSGCLVLV